MKNKTSVSDRIYKQLKNEMINIQILPGANLSENEVSARFQSSRTPIRDVFTRLEADGLLIVKPHVGTFVSKINLDHVRDVLFMREKLELAILEKLAVDIEPMQKFKLSLLLMEQGNLFQHDLDEQQMAEAFHMSDNQLHRTLFEMAQREHVFDNILNCFYDYERYRIFLNLTKKNDLQTLYVEHLELIDNLSVNNLERVEELLHNHLFRSITKAIPRFKRHPEYFIGNLLVDELL